MQTVKSQFLRNITYVRELDSLYDFLKNSQKLSNDLSDLLRAEIVYSVSALDKFIHELVRIGMIETFNGQRVRTIKFEGFTLSAKTLEKIKETAIERSLNPTRPPLPDELPEYWFEREIVLKHKSVSYQTPTNIGDGLSLIWKEEHKWQKISLLMNINEKDVKTQLETIVARRNQIVHEADLDIQNGLKNTISYVDAKDSVDFIEKLGISIFDCVL
ncbi:MAG: HEPN domain-containing protein [Arcicella sp.]|nr:HEPN domain-containing protein [Arcicella sp.]